MSPRNGSCAHRCQDGRTSSYRPGVPNSCYPSPPHQSVLRGCRVLARAHLYTDAHHLERISEPQCGARLEVRSLPQGAQEGADVLGQELGLLHGWEVSAPRHPAKAPEVGVGALDPLARHPGGRIGGEESYR
jgi:hypothetical protein